MPDDIDFFYIGGGVTTLTHVADTNGENASQVAVSASALADDLGVMFDYAVGLPGGGTPSGWTLAATVSGTGGEGRIYVKKLVGGDIGATVTGLSAGTIRRQTISVYRPDEAFDTISFGSGGGFSGTTDPPDQTVVASSQPTPVLVYAGNGTSAAVDMTSSPGFDATINNPGTRLRVGRKIYNTSPANHTISSSITISAVTLLSCYIRVS